VLEQWLPGDLGSDTEIFDFQKAVRAFMGREDVVRSVLASFLDSGEKQLATMSGALEAQQWEPLRQEAHAMKGGAWNLAAASLGKAAAALEAAAKSAAAADCGSAYRLLTQEFERFKNAAAAYTSSTMPTGQ
jgi:HPt (histidine-containing phosphotransfer) domain-containing protein